MPSRATFLFLDGRFSWSETYWALEEQAALGLERVLENAKTLAQYRTALLGQENNNGPYIAQIRVSDDGVFRDSLISTAFDQGNLTPGQRIASPPERPYSVLLLRCESGPRFRKAIYLGGIPDAVITDPVGPTLVPPFRKALDTFITRLIGMWGFKSRQVSGEVPLRQITAFTADAALNNATVASFDTGGLANDASVVISQGQWAKGSRAVRGAFRLYQVQAGTAHLRRSTYTGGYEGGAVARALTYLVRNISDVIVVSMTHRKRGVLGGSPPRGRQRNRV